MVYNGKEVEIRSVVRDKLTSLKKKELLDIDTPYDRVYKIDGPLTIDKCVRGDFVTVSKLRISMPIPLEDLVLPDTQSYDKFSNLCDINPGSIDTLSYPSYIHYKSIVFLGALRNATNDFSLGSYMIMSAFQKWKSRFIVLTPTYDTEIEKRNYNRFYIYNANCALVHSHLSLNKELNKYRLSIYIETNSKAVKFIEKIHNWVNLSKVDPALIWED